MTMRVVWCVSSGTASQNFISGESVPQQWIALSALLWVVDRLHFRYHCGCRIEGGWKVEEVNPYKYDCLHGINTQANEQVFSMIDCWQKCLNACSPTSHSLLLLLFSDEHNKHVNADRGWGSYQKRLLGTELVEPPIPGKGGGTDECDFDRQIAA